MNDPWRDCPRSLKQLIDRFGDLNPFGKPNWRLCLAQHVMVKRAGVFREIEGMKTAVIYGPDGRRYMRKPSARETSGAFEVPRYPHKGWIMERWMPAHVWGTKEEWEGYRSTDGTPMMGPYPSQGDWFLINGPFQKKPDWSDMQNAIAQYECEQRLRPVDLPMAMRMWIKNEQEAEARQLAAYEKELEYICREGIAKVMKSGSLAAQRVRQELAAMTGDRSHNPIL